MILYHYTDDKGHELIGDDGEIVPLGLLLDKKQARYLPMWGREMLALVWLTDLDVPHKEALGLTSYTLDADRTAHRYRVTGGRSVPWLSIRRLFDPRMVNHLESATGALPAHWYVAVAPVPVVYAPRLVL